MATSAKVCPDCLQPRHPVDLCICDDDQAESWREVPFTSPEPDAA